MSSWAIDTLRRVSAELFSHQDGRRISPDLLESCMLFLELVYRELLIQQSLNTLDGNGDQACELVRQALVTLQDIDHLRLAQSEPSAPAVTHGGVGRPRFEIPREQLLFLIESKFTVPQISDMIGVSVRTIHRQLSEYNLSIHSTYTDLTDGELDSIASDIHKEFPMCGNKQMSGHLMSWGIRVQQQNMRVYASS